VTVDPERLYPKPPRQASQLERPMLLVVSPDPSVEQGVHAAAVFEVVVISPIGQGIQSSAPVLGGS
jgi:hypothetical protein